MLFSAGKVYLLDFVEIETLLEPMLLFGHP
jgi:hypothetical protein